METLMKLFSGFVLGFAMMVIANLMQKSSSNPMRNVLELFLDIWKKRSKTSGHVMNQEFQCIPVLKYNGPDPDCTAISPHLLSILQPTQTVSSSTPVQWHQRTERLNSRLATVYSTGSPADSVVRRYLQLRLGPELVKQIGLLAQLEHSVNKVKKCCSSQQKCLSIRSGHGIAQLLMIQNRLQNISSTYVTSLRQIQKELKKH